MSEIMKITHERERQEEKKKKNKDRKTQRSGASYSESVRAKWFCYAFNLGLVQLICKASLIFKSNLELALWVILKERELYESKHVIVECENMRLVILFDMFLDPSFKILITSRYYFISLQHPWYHTFTFHLLFPFYLALIISIFYCLNYTSLLLHLIITHLVDTFYNNYVINLCPVQFLWFI